MIYVMSDIHGHKSRYESIMRQINLQATDHLYVLGDCIDRHPYGLEIMETLYCMPNTTLLLGNHEHMIISNTFLIMLINRIGFFREAMRMFHPSIVSIMMREKRAF